MINKVILVGNLGRDPETRSTGGGMTVANLNLATTERRKDKDGNWSDHTEWHRVVCFGKTADNAARFLKKGRQVYVEGKLRTSKYQDKDGKDRWTTDVIADDLRFLGSGAGRDSEGGSTDSGGYGSSQPNPGGQQGGGYGGGDASTDDIPF